MNLPDKRYIIGIDLGTTNSAVSYVDLSEDGDLSKRIKLFQVPQLTGAGEFANAPVLPSFMYIPGEYDISRDAISIPWPTEEDDFVGAFARDHGSKVPARLVSSAKSWLCHSRVDRRARILPWGAGEEVYNVSPVQATAAYLKHIRKAWNSTKGDNADEYLENQIVIVTAPASFDEVARDLTVEAATMAGLNEITLLEEPLAAFYSWLIRHEKDWDQYVQPNELILVCDVGGGTTDFTLITLREVDGSPRFERIAVGDHLILGGDNIDLALARRIETAISGKRKKGLSLTQDKWKALCHECRQAKEMILGNKAESRKITLVGEGRKLISDTISAEMKRDEVEETVLEGFFPVADPREARKTETRKGITEFGLPYEQEPAITRHIGWFLDRHKEQVLNVLQREDYTPDLILFNGGSLKSGIVQERIRAGVRHWFGLDDPGAPRVLENPDPDLAVAYGASYYGLVKTGIGVRVGSGSARSYYIGVGRNSGADADERSAVCIVERGQEEGSQLELAGRDFDVLANQPVTFDLYSSSFRSGDRFGDILKVDETLTPLPPIQTVVQYGKKGARTTIPVRIEAAYTEMGVLALWCRSQVSNHKWRLQFQLRDAPKSAEVKQKDVFDESVVAEVKELVRVAFSKTGDQSLLDGLMKSIGGVVQRSKNDWPLTLIRSIADELIAMLPLKGVSQKFELRWLNLAGFCMRPGFGDGFDEERIKALWKLHDKGPINEGNPQVRSEWWIFWRRVAGGLQPGRQRQFIQDLTSILAPKKKGGKKLHPQEHLEIRMAVANMERLLVKDKIRWGNELLKEINPKKAKPQQLWALSRMGARELLYGSADRVIPPEEAAKWIERMISEPWANSKQVADALVQIGRKTGDRTRDIPPELVDRIIQWLKSVDLADDYEKFLTRVIHFEKQEANRIFGESLPSGLILRE